MNTLEVVVGAQYGSEAKGHVTQRLAERAQARGQVPTVIRVAGPNAGHTGHTPDGEPVALRQVPVAALTKDPCTLVIAPGSEVDPVVLLDEILLLTQKGLLANKFLVVSREATIITDAHKVAETQRGDFGTNDQSLVKRIGSTGKGIGAARADRLMRGAKRVGDDFDLCSRLNALGIGVSVDEGIVRGLVNGRVGEHVIIEGTQGFALGLHAGYYPYCTSSDCRAIDFCAMAGVNPTEFDNYIVWAVARIYPIRVAGNSGPLRDETTWEALGLPPEFTTVTKKKRRVGHPDWNLVGRAVAANGGARNVRVALTMVDQILPDAKDLIGDLMPDHVQSALGSMMWHIEEKALAPIGLVTTGPNAATFFDDRQPHQSWLR